MPGDALRQQPPTPGNFKDSYNDVLLSCQEDAEFLQDLLEKIRRLPPNIALFSELDKLHKAIEAFEKKAKEHEAN